jgi:hypothetical protein
LEIWGRGVEGGFGHVGFYEPFRVVDASLGIPARSKTNQIFFLAAIVNLWVLPLTVFWFLLVRTSIY